MTDQILLTDDQFEAMAKRVADVLSDHDTTGIEFAKSGYSKPNGEIVMRMAKGKRSTAVKILDSLLAPITWTNPAYNAAIRAALTGADRDCFYDHILAHMCNGGFDVDWVEEND